jgi:hypothetical protein
LLAVAKRPAEESEDGRADLLMRLVEGNVDAVELAAVWRNALLDPEGWAVFADWIRHADRGPDLREHVAALLATLTEIPAMRRRAIFFLTRKADFKIGLPDWAQRAMEDRS